MARPKKSRRVCSLPINTAFVPKSLKNVDEIVMTIDEYETIRLIDFFEMTQEECALKMQIARTTVQAIYMSARKKISDCIVNGKQLLIEGGDVKVCDGKDTNCIDNGCYQRKEG